MVTGPPSVNTVSRRFQLFWRGHRIGFGFGHAARHKSFSKHWRAFALRFLGKLLRVKIPRRGSTKLSVAGPGRCSGQHVAQYSTGRDEE
jgi:hypothetical protein